MWPKSSDLTPIFKACPQISSMSPPGILLFKNEYCMFRQGKPQYKTLATMHVLETPHFSSWMKVGMGKDCLRMWGEVALGSILWPWARWAGGCAPLEQCEQCQCHTWLSPCCCQVVRRIFIFIVFYLKPNQKLGWFCTCHQTDFFFFLNELSNLRKILQIQAKFQSDLNSWKELPFILYWHTLFTSGNAYLSSTGSVTPSSCVGFVHSWKWVVYTTKEKQMNSFQFLPLMYTKKS